MEHVECSFRNEQDTRPHGQMELRKVLQLFTLFFELFQKIHTSVSGSERSKCECLGKWFLEILV